MHRYIGNKTLNFKIDKILWFQNSKMSVKGRFFFSFHSHKCVTKKLHVFKSKPKYVGNGCTVLTKNSYYCLVGYVHMGDTLTAEDGFV